MQKVEVQVASDDFNDDFQRFEGGLLEGGAAEKPRLDRLYEEDAKKFTVKAGSGIEAGVKEERACTDVAFLIIWILFLCSMVAAAVYGFIMGDINAVAASIDADRKLCGGQYPYLYITDWSYADLSYIFDSGVCVESCPREETDTINCRINEDAAYVTSCD